MARKKNEKAAVSRPDVPGRFVLGYSANDEGVHERERVEIEMDDARLKSVAGELRSLRPTLDELAVKVREAKEALAQQMRRHNQLVSAMETGTLTEERDVFIVANDMAEQVSIYDAKTHELLQTREMSYYERQVDMEEQDEE